jgi:endonuclease/exonuclease/phosphatase family metal-dependent hydrolase
MNRPNPRIARVTAVAEATAVFLFFYQALRVLFSVLFGLIYDALFAETASMAAVGSVLIVVVLALLAPLAAPRQAGRRRAALLFGAVIVFLARIPMTLNDPQSRLAASILIVAGTGLYLAARLRGGPHGVVRALILALAVDQVLRAAGHTWDVTLRPEWWVGQVAVSLVLCLLAGWLSQRRPAEELDGGAKPGLLGGLGWGSWLFLEMSLLAFPNAVARWTASPYAVVAFLLLAATWLPLIVGSRSGIRGGRAVGAACLVVTVAGLTLGGLRTGTIVGTASLALAQSAVLVLLPACFPRGRSASNDRLGLALGGFLFLLLSFGYAFTFTYPYTFAFFQNKGLPVFAVAGLLASLPGLRRLASDEWIRPSRLRPLENSAAAATLILLVLVIVLPGRQRGAPVQPLRVATYNVHYGYDTDWHLSLEEQAQTIEASGASVVMLQEVDTGRPTSYMIDDAYWLAQRLNMNAVYLPTIEHLTGIGLLARYPVLDSETLLLPSNLEQTGIIWAKLEVGGTPVNAFAVWLGLEPEERARQLDAALPFIATHPGPAVFGGDFNSTPDSPVYERIHDAGFVDPFIALGLGSPPTDPAINPTKRIDFVWLRNLAPVDAQVLDSLASDHRPVVVEVAQP